MYEYAVELREDCVLVGDQVDHAVRDHDVEAFVRERQLLRLRLDELDVRRTQLGCSRARFGQHLRRHVDARHLPLLAHHLSRDQ